MNTVLLFCLIILCYASTEKEKLLKYFTYGEPNNFDFYDNFETYILKGEVQSSYKSLDFKIYSSINITDIRYLYSNIEYNEIEDINKDSFINASKRYTHYDINHEFTFNAPNSLSTKYLYLLISISPSPPTDIIVYVQSNYKANPVPDSGPSSSSSSSVFRYIVLVLLGIIIIGGLIGCIIMTVNKGGSVCEGIGNFCVVFAAICECVGSCK